MTRDALAGHRMIGMVQPCADEPGNDAPAVYGTGCAGRITSFNETEDGRFLITLTGVARFDIGEEIEPNRGYRRIVPEWRRFKSDLAESGEAAVDRPRLLNGLQAFFKLHSITADWDAITSTPDERLVTSLAMICPFAPSEKQALLEASDPRRTQPRHDRAHRDWRCCTGRRAATRRATRRNDVREQPGQGRHRCRPQAARDPGLSADQGSAALRPRGAGADQRPVGPRLPDPRRHPDHARRGARILGEDEIAAAKGRTCPAPP